MVRRENIVIYFPQFTDSGTLSNSAVTVKANWQTGGDIVQETSPSPLLWGVLLLSGGGDSRGRRP